MRCALIAETGRARRAPFLINAHLAHVKCVKRYVKKNHSNFLYFF